jgi:N-acetylmuramoyl-L-alanine amidase
VKRFILLFLTLLIVHSFAKAQNANLGINKIVIDPGHGGKDPGNGGTGRYKHTEKDVVLEVSLLLGQYLKEAFPEISIIYTRDTDSFVKLSERTRIANEAQADLFLSIHCDAFHDNRVYGSTTYVMGLHKTESNLNVAIRENSSILMENNYEANYEGFNPSEPESYIALSMYQSNHLSNSLLIASKIQNQFKTRVNRKDRGVKQAGFMVISRATMPSVLIELGFLTNKLEEDFLNSKNGKIYMASAIFRAIKEYKLELEASILENFTSKKEIHELYFSVQFLTSTTPLNLDKLTIQNQDLIYSFYDGNYYKYSYGKVKTLKEVYDLKEKLRSHGYNDVFTIAILNGDKISLADALLILK